MSSVLSLFRFPIRLLQSIRFRKFYNKYPAIHRTSYIGEDGIGKGCAIEGAKNISIGAYSFIGTGSELLVYETHFDRPLNSKLKIGNHVRVAARCRITCAGTIVIGNDVLIAPDVFISDHNHGMNPETAGGYSPQDIVIKDVIIGEGVWLGQRVCVLPGVTIGAHSIIGAGGIVTRDIPPYSIAVGNPAKVIKKWDFERKYWETVQSSSEGGFS